MCIVPFEASMSAVDTVDTPLKVTPSDVLKYKLIALLFGPLAEVFVYPAPAVVKSLAVTLAMITWFNKICESTSVGTSSRLPKLLAAKKVAKASFVGAKTVKGPSPSKTFTRSPSAAVSAATKEDRSGESSAISTIF